MKDNKKGFTLIELLVVISIRARKKGRDAKRVGDIKQIQTALELYFNDNYTYPTATGDGVTLGTGSQLALCGGSSPGFKTSCGSDKTYMGIIPVAPTPPTGNVYTYTSAAGADYEIEFTIEEDTGI